MTNRRHELVEGFIVGLVGGVAWNSAAVTLFIGSKTRGFHCYRLHGGP